jgi:hypothetical protein
MSRIDMYKVSWRQNDRIVVDDFRRRNRGATGRKTDHLSKACVHQVHQERAPVPAFESGAAQIHVVNFNSLLDILRHTGHEALARLCLVKRSVNQVHAERANRLLLEHVGRIPHVDMQQYVVGLPTRLLLKAQPDPPVRFIRPRIVACGDGIDETKETSLGSARCA